jgi:predicted enzyme related to lactoylglutathione lyase
MAKRSGKKSAKKRPSRGRRKAVKRPAAQRGAAKARKRAPAPRRRAAKAPEPVVRIGMITHTELASTDPGETQAWCATVLGWQFADPVPTPTGPYRMWRFANNTGGGIRTINPPEPPGSVPYCEVEDIRDAFSRALAAGATEMVGPMALPGGMGWIAIVAAPGGVAIGFWAPK